ncbi:MAG: restriction endonuclease [Nitrospinae bacterium]|nr:restriction endonuclease [Nitrospinota bacterium]MBL7021697.1 restriction endonuclease [Nitrospinaceae bacterium]
MFDTQQSPLLNRVEIPDSEFAPLLDKLSRRHTEDNPKRINYRDLTVQQLGSIYERLLEFELTLDDEGALAIRPNIFARKTSGSYYTPESLVKLILEKTVGPLINEKLELFKNKSEELKKKKSPKKERLKVLKEVDPTSAILNLKICDPAMGSGHFLVSLVDYLADHILESLVESEEIVDWADKDNHYSSPLFQKINSIREQINQQAKEHGWVVNEDQLDDRHIIRRMILKRCVFGVDKNPMAVELAKVSLWLHTFTVGAPLSFLDHHLKCGDSLFGEFVRGAEDYLEERGNMFLQDPVNQAKATAKGMAKIEQITDADISEVKESAEKFKVVEKVTNPLSRFFGFIHAIRWMDIKDKESKQAIQAILDGQEGDPIQLASGKAKIPENAKSIIKDIFQSAKELDEEERFLHWEIAFPGVWDKWESKEPSGGFDAVIGNPPWDRIKLQDVEWFALRKPEIAQVTRASDRKKEIKKLENDGDPLWLDYLRARERAQRMASQARNGGSYPLLSVGDINIYSLFVERAHRLIKPNGMIGLLTPSGIASDKSASNFFKSISTQGRLAGLFDFENKRIFFPDIHSSFKFCAYIAGGKERKFDEARMAFFLHSTEELEDLNRCFKLSPEDFNRVNPNTGTAPIFRTQKDAEITRRVYENFPIFNNHQTEKTWPAKYMRMFDMAKDAKLFTRKNELQNMGFYPSSQNIWKKGEELFVSMLEGKMVQAFDHRAASITINPENINRPGQPLRATLKQHQDPNWAPDPQFWINIKNTIRVENLDYFICFKDVTASTNIRTMISCLMPSLGTNDTLPLFIPENPSLEEVRKYKSFSPLMVANLNSFIFDYIGRQKVQASHLKWYTVEQLPVIPPAIFEGKVGKVKIDDFIRDQVLRLTYTAWDMKPFALDMNYEGDPFIWDEEDRRHRKAKLDALFFNLYEINDEDAAYIMDTFPIVKRHDEEAFDGRYYTKELILAYMKALKAGDTEAKIQL